MQAQTDPSTGITWAKPSKPEERSLFRAADVCLQWGSIERDTETGDEIHEIGKRLIELAMCRRAPAAEDLANDPLAGKDDGPATRHDGPATT